MNCSRRMWTVRAIQHPTLMYLIMTITKATTSPLNQIMRALPQMIEQARVDQWPRQQAKAHHCLIFQGKRWLNHSLTSLRSKNRVSRLPINCKTFVRLVLFPTCQHHARQENLHKDQTFFLPALQHRRRRNPPTGTEPVSNNCPSGAVAPHQAFTNKFGLSFDVGQLLRHFSCTRLYILTTV
ncbi:hypothetical protein BDV93DRAFT_345046 [Ceratobasidium sp. AG-I]|nr:hypothetical protein BDV93DRAFT_345046 [Ceratobasidium sp. AG-I]